MAFFEVKMATGTTLSFQVEAADESEARRKMDEAYNEYCDEILDAIDDLGDVETDIVSVEESPEQWDPKDTVEVVPGVYC